MKNSNRHFLHLNSQFGGMMVELMLSLALASIAIPFIFRYQKNTIERAHNIEVVKQMETVQHALEKCMVAKQGTLLNNVSTPIFSENNMTVNRMECVYMSKSGKGLINYGLTQDFVNKYKNSYKLRILKSPNGTGSFVLQGVVILNDNSLTALRTREIVNMGGGKIGFIDGNNVYGGFNSFKKDKNSFGANNNTSGVVGTTATMQGNTEYLWRTGSDDADSASNATMLSNLNLNGQNIDDVGTIYVSQAYFDNTLTANTINVRSLQFMQNVGLGANYSSETMNVSFGDIVNAGGSNLNACSEWVEGEDKVCKEGTLTFKEEALINNFILSSLEVTNGMALSKYTLPSSGDVKFTVNGDLILKNATATNLVINDAGGVIVPKVTVTERIVAPDNDTYYWEIAGIRDGRGPNTGNFYDIILKDTNANRSLYSMLSLIYEYEENKASHGGSVASAAAIASADANYCLSSRDKFREVMKNGEGLTLGDSLKILESVQSTVMSKYYSLWPK